MASKRQLHTTVDKSQLFKKVQSVPTKRINKNANKSKATRLVDASFKNVIFV